MKTTLNKKHLFSVIAILAIGLLLGMFILSGSTAKPAADEHGHGHNEAAEHADAEHHGSKAGDEHGHSDEHADGEHHEDGPAKGPHGGKLFTEDGFGLEILLAEEGGEPRFRAYLFEEGKPLPPGAANVSLTLTRPDGEKQEIGFTPEKYYLKSTAIVTEPHVFSATVAAQKGNEPFLFTFEEQEGKIALTDAQIKASNISIEAARPAQIKNTIVLPGEIQFNQDKTAHIVPRVSGVVEKVPANLGQQVKKGDVLAVIASTDVSEQRSELLAAQKRLALARTTFEREKKLWQEKISAEQDYLEAQQAMQEAEIAVRNARQKLTAMGAGTNSTDNLNRYEVRAPFDGMVVEKHIALGEAVKEDANIFVLSDLSTVWAEAAVPAKNLDAVRVGEEVTVRSTASDAKAQGTIAQVGALIGEQTRTAKARVTLDNPNMAWRPGLVVSVEVVANNQAVAVAVPAEAVTTVNDESVVFLRVPGGFLPQPVKTGRTSGEQVEIVEGLKAGSQVAGAGSFIIKSELGKASAEHTH